MVPELGMEENYEPYHRTPRTAGYVFASMLHYLSDDDHPVPESRVRFSNARRAEHDQGAIGIGDWLMRAHVKLLEITGNHAEAEFYRRFTSTPISHWTEKDR